jgi:hypothetical protein
VQHQLQALQQLLLLGPLLQVKVMITHPETPHTF